MNKDIIIFFNIYRQIFGVCPCCGEIFRLSDAKISSKRRFKTDWLEKIEKKKEYLDKKEEKFEEIKEKIQEKAREKGYRRALKFVKQIDTVFLPRKLNADDAKVIFHPVDYAVFDGLVDDKVKKVIILDRKYAKDRRLQKSVEKVIEKKIMSGKH
ncbi:MAG: hypothetical protein N2114_01310 [Candidatus Goldbacteria bacterium]|nr:hypothetical protein [Candidatus Goldiibacteriota bacterium]